MFELREGEVGPRNIAKEGCKIPISITYILDYYILMINGWKKCILFGILPAQLNAQSDQVKP